MRTRIARTAQLLVVLALLTGASSAVAGCGSEQAGSGEVRDTEQAPDPAARARQVAAAWDGSRAAEVWRQGYYPMADMVQLPEDAFHDADDKEAYVRRNFVLQGELPARPPEEGRVKWQSGGSLTLPLMDAGAAYERLAGGGGDGPHLTVTGAKLGETTLTTSRGPATVPAWLFTLEGYDTPLKRVALSPSKLPAPPIEPAAEVPSDALWPLRELVRVAGDGRSVTVVAEHGACDDGPAVDVLETDGSVVLSGSIVDTDDGPCTLQLLGKEVTVKLGRPMGARVLLDSFTGQPVPHVERHG